MRICFVLPRYHTNLHNWVHKHLEEGDSVKFLLYHDLKRNANCPVKPEIVPWSRSAKFIKNRFPSFSLVRFGVPNIKVLKHRLAEFNPDLLVIRDPSRVFSIVTILIALLLRVRFVLYTQVPLFSDFGFLKKSLMNSVTTFTKSVIITPVKGSRTKPKMVKRFFYIPFVMHTEQSVEKENAVNGKILTIGKYIPRKNHLLLIDALNELSEEFVFELVMIGATTGKGLEEYKQRVTDYIRTKGMQSYVHQRDVVPYAEMQNLYYEFDLFVLASRDEEVGVSVLEAMAHGLPVICSDTAGASDFIRQEQNGMVFKSDDKESLKDAISFCLRDKTRLLNMGEHSRKIVKHYYSPDTYYNRIQLLINKILG